MEQKVLDIVKRTVPQGDAQGVLDAMDNFVRSGKGLLINIGDTKAVLIEAVVARRQPKVRQHPLQLPTGCACQFAASPEQVASVSHIDLA